MTEAIVAAIVTGLIGLVGTITTVVITNRQNRLKMTYDMEKQQALLTSEIEHIKEDLRKHNGYAQMFSESIPVIREQIKVANHRIDDLEKKVG